MTDTKRAILLFEYDDGTRRAFEFTQVSDATLNHGGLPGPARMTVSGPCQAVNQFPLADGDIRATIVDAIEATGGDSDEQTGP